MAVNVESAENNKKFPYRILNDLSQKLKSAEDKIATLLDERKSPRYNLQMSCGACNQALLSESTADRTHCEAFANVDALKEEVCLLQKKVAELVYMNNRYHISISNCTVCTSDDVFSNASLSDEEAIKASTPVTTSLDSLEPSISPVPCSVAPNSFVPALSSSPLLSRSVETRQDESVKVRKDKTFISRMMKTLNKLESKYSIPEHRRKARIFMRKKKESPIVPKEFSTIFHVLAAPEPDMNVLEPYPQVKWNDIRFKPGLPNPELFAVHSCSQDPEFYQDKKDLPCTYQRWAPHSFGTLPGFKTSLGIVAVPATPVGGYVYCPDAKKWVLFAEPRSSPPRYSASTARRTRQGGTTLLRRRKG